MKPSLLILKAYLQALSSPLNLNRMEYAILSTSDQEINFHLKTTFFRLQAIPINETMHKRRAREKEKENQRPIVMS